MKATIVQFIFIATANAFIPSSYKFRAGHDGSERSMVKGMATSTSAPSDIEINNQIANLKRVLFKEYTSFFDPMVCACSGAAPHTTFNYKAIEQLYEIVGTSPCT